MFNIDETDRKILNHLKVDGRASITTLAGALGLARGTVQSRLTQINQSPTIKSVTTEF
jgi:DNA-binding Lrp family transcriptional regulator